MTPAGADPAPLCASALLNELLADATSAEVVRVAHEMLDGLDEAAAAADDKLTMFVSKVHAF